MKVKESDSFDFILTVPNNSRSKKINTLPYKLLPRGASKSKPKYEPLIRKEQMTLFLESPPRISRKLEMKLTKSKKGIINPFIFRMKEPLREPSMKEDKEFRETHPCTPRSQIICNTNSILDRNKRVPRINRDNSVTSLPYLPSL